MTKEELPKEQLQEKVVETKAEEVKFNPIPLENRTQPKDGKTRWPLLSEP